MASFLDQISAFTRRVEKQIALEPKATRKALNAGAKVLKDTVKPLVPLLKRSTDTRQKGTVKNNFRHKTTLYRDKTGGKAVVRVRRTKGRKMAAVSDNTKDRTDPFYWFMLDRGTKKMTGYHFMEKAQQQGTSKALQEAKRVFIEEMRKG